MGRTPHTATYKGKRVHVRTRSGEEFVDKFVDRSSRFVVFDKHKVERSKIKSFTIVKGYK